MQAAPCFSIHLPLTPTRTQRPIWRSQTRPKAVFPQVRAVTQEPSTVDYSSLTSVFPAEACETIGGEACTATMYPEVKLKTEPTRVTAVSEEVDREYLEYNEPKTVFPGEACDDLGGEFCEAEYQMGVFQDK
ncbi:light-regulated protein, chloroplastic [Aristolochia californica]|uniref:light-regulated protein, chloroplastic n=1 Tax=Aristolochia californica TaxID=171875 RepID=UPI0035E2624D